MGLSNRKIIQIVSELDISGTHGQTSTTSIWFALCNDGTIWEWTKGRWFRRDDLENIPQD